MNYLLDTHAFIWADSEPGKLSAQVTTLLRNRRNIVFISIASLWEMQIKLQTGKITLRMPLQDIVPHQQKTNRIEILSITLPHVLALNALPPHHKDPFDRILIAQARIEGLTLITHDRMFSQYPVQVVW
jgi:PIN domain nuclease of toxin-antitoxin system